ncbi:chromate transporter [Paraflavisolibacter sp. H34]|uniref:chromate transporter n=1 Tax=Huijunlia imazamoxiresistens TaxID=3127457 RepID=UPI00301A3D3E
MDPSTTIETAAVVPETPHQPPYSLKQLIGYFFKLGYAGFGGPVALVGYMHRDLVEERKWITEEEYRDGLALAQLAPGPLAAQLGIYLGYVHYQVLGATLCGLAFVLPSFLMVVAIGLAYTLFGGLPWMQAIFYGVGAAVVGIIAISSYKLTEKSVSKINGPALAKNWLLWLFFVLAAIVTVITESEEMLLFIAAGLLYMFVKAPPRGLKKASVTPSVWLLGIGFGNWTGGTLGQIAWFFTKAGAFVFGSGLAIVPFLHAGVVQQYGWLNEQQFLDAVAVAMITPGPVVITVGFIGYLVAGFPGACVAALATFLPCYLLTVLPAPYFKKYGRHPSIKAFVDGITAAVVGALVGAVVVIALRTIKDVPTALIALATIFVLLKWKVKEPAIILAAAALGLILKLFILV